jgi:tetratricopeptide (TPR) repeat protein
VSVSSVFRNLLICSMVPAIVHAFSLGANDTTSDSAWSRHTAAAKQLEDAGNLAGAQSEWDAALRDANAGTDTAASALVLAQMGAFYDDIGQFAKAESCLEHSLRLWRERLGSGHIALVRVVNQLAALYIETSQLGKAERLHLDEWRQRLQADNPAADELLPLVQYMGILTSMRGRFTEAQTRFQQALDLVQRRGRWGTAEQAVTLNNIGLAGLRAKQYDFAIQHLSVSMSLWEKLRGPDARNVGMTAYNLALAYDGAGRRAEAEPLMRRALTIAEKSVGPDSLRTADIVKSYARLLSELHRKAEAKQMTARADRLFREQAQQQPSRYEVDVTDLSFQSR